MSVPFDDTRAFDQTTWISPDEYLAREAASPTRHEYIDGLVYAMVLVAQARRHVSHHIPTPDGGWTVQDVAGDGVVVLNSVAAEITLADIYHEV